MSTSSPHARGRVWPGNAYNPRHKPMNGVFKSLLYKTRKRRHRKARRMAHVHTASERQGRAGLLRAAAGAHWASATPPAVVTAQTCCLRVLESQVQKSRYHGGRAPPEGSREVQMSFQLLEPPVSLSCGPSLRPQSQQQHTSHLTAFFDFDASPSCRTLGLHWAHPDHPGSSPRLRILVPFATTSDTFTPCARVAPT